MEAPVNESSPHSSYSHQSNGGDSKGFSSGLKRYVGSSDDDSTKGLNRTKDNSSGNAAAAADTPRSQFRRPLISDIFGPLHEEETSLAPLDLPLPNLDRRVAENAHRNSAEMANCSANSSRAASTHRSVLDIFSQGPPTPVKGHISLSSGNCGSSVKTSGSRYDVTALVAEQLPKDLPPLVLPAPVPAIQIPRRKTF